METLVETMQEALDSLRPADSAHDASVISTLSSQAKPRAQTPRDACVIIFRLQKRLGRYLLTLYLAHGLSNRMRAPVRSLSQHSKTDPGRTLTRQNSPIIYNKYFSSTARPSIRALIATAATKSAHTHSQQGRTIARTDSTSPTLYIETIG